MHIKFFVGDLCVCVCVCLATYKWSNKLASTQHCVQLVRTRFHIDNNILYTLYLFSKHICFDKIMRGRYS